MGRSGESSKPLAESIGQFVLLRLPCVELLVCQGLQERHKGDRKGLKKRKCLISKNASNKKSLPEEEKTQVQGKQIATLESAALIATATPM